MFAHKKLHPKSLQNSPKTTFVVTATFSTPSLSLLPHRCRRFWFIMDEKKWWWLRVKMVVA